MTATPAQITAKAQRDLAIGRDNLNDEVAAEALRLLATVENAQQAALAKARDLTKCSAHREFYRSVAATVADLNADLAQMI